jgi:hypothetical protein
MYLVHTGGTLTSENNESSTVGSDTRPIYIAAAGRATPINGPIDV